MVYESNLFDGWSVGNDLCFFDFLLSWYHVLSKLGKKIDAPIFLIRISKRPNKFP